MTIEVKQFRLSLIWTEAFAHLLDGVTPVTEDRAFLGHSVKYIQQFEEMQAELRQAPYRRHHPPQGVHLPWPGPWGQRLWMHYLGGIPPGQADGASAWNLLVPFREKSVGSIKAPWLSGSVYHETFLYPHGVGFVLNITFRPHLPTSLQRALKVALAVRRDRTFLLPLNGRQVSLMSERLAAAVMDEVRSRQFPNAIASSHRMKEPFTIFTVMGAIGADASKPPPPSVVAALAACTSWKRGWDPASPPALTDSNRLPPDGGGVKGDLMFAGRRGRAVWFPRLFDAGREQHALGCFHRNLTLLSLQVDSLAGLVRLGDGFIRRGQDIPVRMHECLSNALAVLDDLSEGRRASTYRSYSPNHQLKGDDVDVTEVMKRVEDFLT